MRTALASFVTAFALLLLPAAAAAHDDTGEVGELIGGAAGGAPLPDNSSPLDERSQNMKLVANFDDGGTYRQGSDEAFWGNLAILSSYDNPGGFRIVDISNPAAPSEVGQFACKGPQNDVSIWQNLVFVSVDSPRNSPTCENGGVGGASQADILAGNDEKAWEGIRIVDISDRSNPRQIKTVYTDCGSHTHTLVPDEANNRVLIYVESYPLNPQGADCNPVSHGKISVVEVPLGDPTAARVVSTPSVRPAVGCHDVTVYREIDLAAAACITESQLWDISDPANPTIVSHIANPAINIHHSTTFNWDGNTLVIGDELGGAVATPGCPEGADQHLPLGALWFYDVSNPASPQLRGTYKIPQGEGDSIFCTAHNFNTVPLKSDRDILVSAWYNGGTTVVDYTNPADVQQLGFYIAHGPTQSSGTAARPDGTVRSAAWSSYWYNGLIYANNFDEDVNSISPISRGLDVFQISHPSLRKSIKLSRLNAQTMERAAAQG